MNGGLKGIGIFLIFLWGCIGKPSYEQIEREKVRRYNCLNDYIKGTRDLTVYDSAFQAIYDRNHPDFVKGARYLVSKDLILNPNRNRAIGFIVIMDSTDQLIHNDVTVTLPIAIRDNGWYVKSHGQRFDFGDMENPWRNKDVNFDSLVERVKVVLVKQGIMDEDCSIREEFFE